MAWRYCFNLPSGQRICIPIYVIIKKWPRDPGDPWHHILDEFQDPGIPVQFSQPESYTAVQDLVRLSAISELAASISRPELTQQIQGIAAEFGQRLAAEFLPDAEFHTDAG